MCLAQPALAQDQPRAEPTPAECPSSASLSERCQASFESWQAAEQKWRAWVERYGNQIVWSNIGQGTRKRPVRPAVPDWIAALCAPLPAAGLPDSPVCRAFTDYQQYDWVRHYAGPPPPPVRTRNKAVGEGADIWTWLVRSMHYDIGWVPAQTDARFLLIGGVHLSLAQISKRVFVFAPGVMLVRISTAGGHHAYRPAQTWGLSVRLRDFRFPWSKKDYSFYFNLANCRIAGMETLADSLSVSGSSMSVMGFSISLKK
jgi:hypothetical protein